MNAIIQAQNLWYVVLSPMAALIFIVAAIAELGRAPFDLNEAESEIVAGFHIEYTGMKFGLFYAGELLHAFTFGGFWAILFFGGYRLFGLERLGPLVAAAILMAKALFGYWVIMWVRYTVMRVRIDHMLALNWKFLTPLAFAVLMMTAILHTLLRGPLTGGLCRGHAARPIWPSGPSPWKSCVTSPNDSAPAWMGPHSCGSRTIGGGFGRSASHLPGGRSGGAGIGHHGGHHAQPDPRGTLARGDAFWCRGSVCHPQCGLPCDRPGRDLHWRHRDLVHLCRYADAQRSARSGSLNRTEVGG